MTRSIVKCYLLSKICLYVLRLNFALIGLFRLQAVCFFDPDQILKRFENSYTNLVATRFAGRNYYNMSFADSAGNPEGKSEIIIYYDYYQILLLDTTTTRYYYQILLLLDTTTRYYYYQILLLLDTTTTRYYYYYYQILLLLDTTTRYYYYYYYQILLLLLDTTTRYHYQILLLPLDTTTTTRYYYKRHGEHSSFDFILYFQRIL